MSAAASKSPSPSPDAGAVAANAERHRRRPPRLHPQSKSTASARARRLRPPRPHQSSPLRPMPPPSLRPPHPPAPAAGALTAGDWQAIWSPAHNAYYFFNAATQQTTWENPLQPTAGPSSSSASPPDASSAQSPSGTGAGAGAALPAIASMYALQEAAAAQGIDPSLAFLDPSLAGQAGPSGAYAYSAKFNARTGAFAKPDGRDPTHLSEYERAKRMSQVYFDVGAWEKEVEARKEEEEENGKKRKRPTKKDLVSLRSCLLWLLGTLRRYSARDTAVGVYVLRRLTHLPFQDRFKEQKRLKKIAKTAWLRT
ncbi:hypothetical protein EVG20_g6985 [Dentipellis fragilis]|uniref:WW domain-containing protein n=1 Tax=Dentipellis fragilis TaxID=205917 RepID=A0A4Y9YGG2_9AGAM|nr:hypothetical protein EVG20_g6985 [Dentipellis fragilis]